MVRLAMVGCGGMAQEHAKHFKQIRECEMTALCDIVPERAESTREKHFPKARTFDDYETMLAQIGGELDGVVFVTPHALHYPHSITALQRGLHVLCEKPMVTRSEHAYDLWRAARRSGKVFSIAFQAPYSAAYQTIRRMQRDGELGRPQLISGWLAQGWKDLTPGTWRQQPEVSGGGQMYDSGSHVLNGMMWIMDEPVVEVGCFYDRCGTPVDINGVAILRFQSGAMGSVSIGGASPGWDTQIRLQTDALQLHTQPHGGQLTVRRGDKPEPAMPGSSEPAAFTPQRNFVQSILGREPSHCPPRYGVLLSALMDALYESADTQSLVKVKPVPQEIDA